MPRHRFDGFQVGVTSDSSATGATITLADADQHSRCSERKKKMFRVICAASLLLCLFVSPAVGAAAPPGKLELSNNWKLSAAKDTGAGGAAISTSDYQDRAWHPIRRMPATVLEILQEDGVYSDLYVGKNMLEKVPQDLYKQDWWYRTVLHCAGRFLDLHARISRASTIAPKSGSTARRSRTTTQIVGMYAAHELNVTQWIKRGRAECARRQSHA